MSKRKLIVYNLVVLALFFVIGEWVVRSFFPDNKPFDQRKENNLLYSPSGFTRKWMNEDQVVYKSVDGVTDKDARLFHINKQGFRDTVGITALKDSGEIRIAILGGSHVFDLNSYDFEGNYGFSAGIEYMLQQAGINCRVINAGEPGAQTLDFPAKLLYSLSKYHPDYVVVNSEWNDIKWINGLTIDSQLNKTSPQAVVKNPLIEKVNVWDDWLGWSVIYRKLRDRYWRKELGIESLKAVNEGIAREQTHHTGGVYAEGLRQYRLNLAVIVKIIELIGAKPILAIEERLVAEHNTTEDKTKIQYVVAGAASHEELVYLYKSCDSLIQDVANEYQLPLIDANKAVGGNGAYFRDHVHTTPEGSRAIAKVYSDFFLYHLFKQGNLGENR